MPTKRLVVRYVAITVVLCSVTLLSQQKPAVPSSSGVYEFPVRMRQNVVAGTNPVGTKVEAKLAVATLVGGAVIPRDATFSGEIVESEARSATDPSRLAIRMNSVRWKKGSVPIKVYLTAWYYPIKAVAGQNLEYGPPEGPIKTWNGMGTYPDSRSPAGQPFPGSDAGRGPEVVPNSTASSISNHRALMKDVESRRNSDGTIGISSRRFNIKLDKLATYVLATDELQPTK